MQCYELCILTDSDGDFAIRKNKKLYTENEERGYPEIRRYYFRKEDMYEDAIILLNDNLEGIQYSEIRPYLNDVVDKFREVVKEALELFRANEDEIACGEDFGNQRIHIYAGPCDIEVNDRFIEGLTT